MVLYYLYDILVIPIKECYFGENHGPDYVPIKYNLAWF